MRRVFALLAGASLASAVVEYDEEDMNFLRMLAFNDSNTTLMPTTLAPTTLMPTTLAPSGNATDAPATEAPGAATDAPAVATDEPMSATNAPVEQAGNSTPATGAPAADLTGSRVRTTTTLEATYPNDCLGSCELPKAIAVGFWEFSCSKAVMNGVFLTMKACKDSATHADKITRRLNATDATSAPAAMSYTWLGVMFEYDAGWTCATLAGWKPMVPAGGRRRHLTSTAISDKAEMSVWSTDADIAAAAKTSADAVAADTTGMLDKINLAVEAKASAIQTELPNFNISSLEAALNTMTATVSVGTVETNIQAGADQNPTTSNAQAVTALGSLVLAGLAASLF